MLPAMVWRCGLQTSRYLRFIYHLCLPLELRLLLPKHNLPLGLENFLEGFRFEVLDGADAAL